MYLKKKPKSSTTLQIRINYTLTHPTSNFHLMNPVRIQFLIFSEMVIVRCTKYILECRITYYHNFI